MFDPLPSYAALKTVVLSTSGVDSRQEQNRINFWKGGIIGETITVTQS